MRSNDALSSSRLDTSRCATAATKVAADANGSRQSRRLWRVLATMPSYGLQSTDPAHTSTYHRVSRHGPHIPALLGSPRLLVNGRAAGRCGVSCGDGHLIAAATVP